MAYVIGMKALVLALLAAKLVCSQTLPTAWRTGIATNYGGPADGMDPSNPSFGTSLGSCGYGPLDKTKFPYWSVGALSLSNMYYQAGPLNGCGECFEIQCVQNGQQWQGNCNADANSRSVTVQITDTCPECEADHLDLQALTFNKMAPINKGRIQIQYRRVQCTPPSGITINVDSNSGSGGWLRLTVQKVAGAGSISLVQVKGPNSGWVSMNNYWGASWEIAGSPAYPVDMRIQQSDGTEVTAFSFLQANGQKGTLPVGVNFATDPSANAGVTAITTLAGIVASDKGSSATTTTNTGSSSGGGSASASAYSSSSSGSGSGSGSQQVTAFGGPPQQIGTGSASPPSSPPTAQATQATTLQASTHVLNTPDGISAPIRGCFRPTQQIPRDTVPRHVEGAENQSLLSSTMTGISTTVKWKALEQML